METHGNTRYLTVLSVRFTPMHIMTMMMIISGEIRIYNVNINLQSLVYNSSTKL